MRFSLNDHKDRHCEHDEGRRSNLSEEKGDCFFALGLIAMTFFLSSSLWKPTVSAYRGYYLMPTFEFTQRVGQLPQNRGAYFYLHLSADVVNQFEKKRNTRLICEIDEKVRYSCGLNHMGDGSFFIILSKKNLKALGKELNAEVSFRIFEDPNPLGVEVPEVLQVLLDQDPDAKATYKAATDGLKRSLIFYIKDVKNVDVQVKRILETLEKFRLKQAKKTAKR